LKIKRLELVGFKSFKDKTVINFDAGITGIVGPNGCGKSNIVDALTWVMGEQSAKHLRGASMEDVIFNGSENFAPLGMCEVSLTLENDGGAFPAKWAKHSEVMITRKLHRSGESEYSINREEARLKDIVDIFLDTGAGSKGFSIVEQGQIGKIITAKPEDRRSLIEEAAGITKFKVRKRESQRKLESTDGNLVRLNDIIGELRRQLDSLQRQAKRAERFKELKNQAQDLDLWVSSHRFLSIKKEITELASSIDIRKIADEEVQAQYSILIAQLQELKLELLEIEQKVTAKQGRHFEVQSQAQKKESSIQLLQVEIESIKRNEEMAGTLRGEIAARRDILSRDLDHTTSLLQKNETELSYTEQDALEKSETSATQSLRAREVDERVTQIRRELMSVVQGLTTVEIKIASLSSQKESFAKRLGESELIQTELESKRQEFETHRTKAFNTLENQRQMQLAIMTDVKNFEENLTTIKIETATRKSQVENFKDEYNKVVSRLYGLETVHHNFEGFQEGVKQVMTWQRERMQPLADGGFELVADVVEVPQGFEMAMEAALGERLQGILAPSSATSVTAIGLLKEKRAGRSSFINPDLACAAFDSDDEGLAASDVEIQKSEGVRGLLKEIVKCPQQHKKALAHILDNVVVVEDISSALRLRSGFSGYTFVTLDGDVLSHQGVLTGGSSDAGDSGLLKQRREIKELSLLKDECSGKLALATASLEKLEAQVVRVSKDFEAAQKQSFEHELLILERKKDLERAESELKNADEAIRRQTRDVDGVKAQLATVSEQLDTAMTTCEELRTQRVNLEITSDALESELKGLKEGLDELAQQATEAQVLAATKRQAFEGLKEQHEKLGKNLSETEIQLSRMSEDSFKNSDSLNQYAVQLEEVKSDFNKLIDEVKSAERDLNEVRNSFEVKSAQVRELEVQTSNLQQQSNKSGHEIGEAQVRLSQVTMNEKYLVDQVLERYMMNLHEIAPNFENREGDLQLAASELEELRDKIKKIGEVNLTAIQEYEELTNRYEFLTKQQQDLLGAMDSLRKVIDRINRICNRRFRETFEAVNERFKKVFPVLFGGGEAQLILVESPDAQGEPGVEIMARPPGKKLQSVTLLSGGEKALTAVSLIFAIFLFKPSPFCLLDEVDAPLDDANVYRFNDLVKEMAKRSQIILVTHNKHTMEINNTLYGVTMEDPGVSKMVAVQLNA
jgi:chromosome segregation protein